MSWVCIKKPTAAAFIAIVVMTAFLWCGKSRSPIKSQDADPPFASFRDIPGATNEEIKDVEALLGKYGHFVYGVRHTTEAFPRYIGEENGVNEVGGYAARFCAWLTAMFGIPFKPEIYDWGGLMRGLESGKVHFTGELTATADRQKTYFMTDAIAERSLKTFRLKEAPPISEVMKSRPPRFAIPYGFAQYGYLREVVEYEFESIFVAGYAAARRAIETGEADAILAVGVAEPALDTHGDIVSEMFYPLVFTPVSLSSRKPELEPIITLVQKALENGGARYLSQVYGEGHRDYVKNKWLASLSGEEIEYVRHSDTIRVVTEYDSYPLSFYNRSDGELQGITIDVMREVAAISGLSFEPQNRRNAGYLDLINMVESGEASMITAMMRSKERTGRFLMPSIAIASDRPVLISKLESPNLQLNQIPSTSVAIVRGTTHAGLFKQWFPNARGVVEYGTLDSAFGALESGNVDMMMSMSNFLLSIESYKELAGYKVNVAFDKYFDITFGFNRDEDKLCSVVDKALRLIDMETISGHWMRMRYDHRAKVAQAQRPWLIGAIALSLVTLALVLVLFFKGRTERRSLAKLVAEETSTITAIFDATPDHIFCKDLDSRYTRCNKSFEEFFGLRKPYTDYGKGALGMPQGMTDHFVGSDEAVFNQKHVVVSEEIVPSQSGEVVIFEVVKTPLIQDGKVTGLVGMSRDITQRRVIEEELKKAYSDAENALEAKSRFVANMNHEMRTPMNAIVGLTNLLLDESDIADKIKETLQKVKTAGGILMELICDVLDISKIESGKFELAPVQYETAALLNDIITLNMIRIEGKPIVFKLEVSESVPQSLYGDDLRVKQILNNLLSNAFKYTNEGAVTLGMDSRCDGGNVWVYFSISDTGIGIREEDVAKLFTDYNQVDTGANRKIEGTGLGLSITKKFVEMMNGEITVESAYGKGTTFRVRIMQGVVNDEVIGKETAESLNNLRHLGKKSKPSKKLARADLSHARVLVVDDYPTNLDVAAGMLRKYKMHVDCASSGLEAVELISAGEPLYDAVFMDHMMPIMDGMEAAAKIRAMETEYAKTIPIIALTANAVAGNEQMFLENGFNAFLPKPFNVMGMDSVVLRFVRDKYREQRTEAEG